MITISQNALEKVRSLIKDEGKNETAFLRVSVLSGGCSGLSYKMDFDTELKAEDKVFEDKGVRVVVDKKSMLYVIGTELDYLGGLNGKGFVFKNPNATRTCGCGESFAV